ncbi:MAG: bifunctional alpha,alpha-trehalose-phosphate synthase (UDP-forming)/trehalose-phosphatase [Myxococcaceae bacterium]|jgi:trehalose 6-phosphate synthase/phosphatase|nr:bifunctional alpha,alpha-trehalose-phosphate synthase (UDP-forming)/trehalose-phosphatase [Myxococcaceae bacterium]
MARTLIVSNRLPVTVSLSGEAPTVERSSGGLATGLKSVHRPGESLWVGWPGFAGAPPLSARSALDARFDALGVVPVTLEADEVERYYEGYCNGVLWPLFHGFPGQLPLEVPHFPLYRAVNERFADTVARLWRPGDVVWVHDYQLLLVPRLVRERCPDARIGFFLHIPFPPADIFRTLPAREALLEGVLAADLVGFHTASYLRNFASSALHVLGAEAGFDGVQHGAWTTQLGVFPMGIDAQAFDAVARTPAVDALVAEARADAGLRLLVGIDRLDYTKGIPRRLLAYERLLADHPALRGKVRLVQVAVPSRTNVDAYAEFRTTVDALIGRINGRFGTPAWAPVHYVYRNLSEPEVVALYRAADVMLVTPIRDGMNLVSKEFVASRVDGDGVLVLSEFAGAADELAEALHANPYDVEGLAQTCARALELPEAERRARMKTLRRRVASGTVERWASRFLETLRAPTPPGPSASRAPSPRRAIETTARALAAAPSLVLLLDYDGTLVPFTEVPDLARPDQPVLTLLAQLARRPHTSVHVVSGRSRDTLEAWLGHLPLGLHAEHGFFSRAAGAQAWTSHAPVDDGWRPRALELLEDFAARTPGSLVEEKRSGLAFHFRAADREFGPRQANELKAHLSTLFANAPVEVLSGDQVVELRPHGAHKGQVVPRVLAAAPPDALVAAFGDDRTDEDLFKALPVGGVAVHVGPLPSVAPVRIGSVTEVRRFLTALASSERSTPP